MSKPITFVTLSDANTYSLVVGTATWVARRTALPTLLVVLLLVMAVLK